MGFNIVRLTKFDVDPAAVGQTTWLARREVFVGISDSLVKLLLEFVFFSVRIGISNAPYRFYKLLALLVSCELLPGVAFRLRKDQIDIVDPVYVGLLDLALDLTWLLFRVGVYFLSSQRKG